MKPMACGIRLRSIHPSMTFLLVSAVLCLCGAASTPLCAQKSQAPGRVRITPAVGYAIAGDYFRGPGDVGLSTENGLLLGLDVGLNLTGPLSLAASVAHGRTDWTVGPLPLVGTVGLDGAQLWFVDLALRGEWPAGPLSLFVQGGAGVARYSISNPLISGARENLALSAGAGVRAPIHSRIEAVGLLKDYIVSFQSLDDLAALGVTGRRSHTIALMAGLTFSW
jgi:hypothetical protein